jgi:hypothetical protein
LYADVVELVQFPALYRCLHISKTQYKVALKHQNIYVSVDGVLLYASYLSKGFDVLAIAISGETKR